MPASLTKQSTVAAATRLKNRRPDLDLGLNLDWQHTIEDTDNRRASNIPNTVNTAPALGLPANRLHQEQYLRNMRLLKNLAHLHRQVVREITGFIDRQNVDGELSAAQAQALAGSIIGEYLPGQVIAYDKPDFQAFLKLLTFFALVHSEQEPQPQLAAKVAQWYSAAQPVFKQLKLDFTGKNALDALTKRTVGDPNDKATKRAMNDLSSHMRALRQGIHRNTKIFHAEHSKQRSLLGKLLTYYNSGSENAYRDIVNNVGLLNDPVFKHIEPEAKTATDAAKTNIADFVKQHGGKGLELTEAQEARLKKSNPEQWKAYRKHALTLRDARKTEIKKLVRASGQAKLPAREIKAAMDKLGLSTSFIPQGFDGFYDENSDMYSNKGERLAANIAGGRYIVNRSYNAKKHGQQYIATHDNPRAEKPQKVYTLHHITDIRADKKADIVAHNTANFPAIKTQWRHDMRNANTPAEVAYAHLMEALYQTSSRIGSGEGKTDGKRTYGMRSILKRHVRENADGSITISFPGKSGMQQAYRIKPDDNHRKKLIAYIKAKLVGKDKSDPVWTIGKTNQIKTHDATNYIQSLGWKSGSHKLRHMRGNELADEYMRKHPPKKQMTGKEVNEYVNKLGLEVGKALGHKRTLADGRQEPVATTALKSYIDPLLIADVYRGKQVPLPAWLEKMVKTAD